jgi:misacylated tRNA(Ala) deacylase
MRFHTTTHLLCHVVPQLVNGCSITPDYARLDFNMTDPLDKDALTAGIAALVAAAHPVTVGVDHRRRAGRQPGPGQEHEREPAARQRRGPHHPHRREPTRRSTCSPAAAPMWPTRPRLAPVVVTKIEKKSATTRRVVLGFA